MKKINRLLAFLLAFTVVITTFSSDLTTAKVFATEEETVIDTEDKINTVEKEEIETPVVAEASKEETTEETTVVPDEEKAEGEEEEENEDAAVTGADEEVVDPEAVVEEEIKEAADAEEAEEDEIISLSTEKDDIKISLSYKKGVLPEDAELIVSRVDSDKEDDIQDLLDEETGEDVEVEETISFDINIKSESEGDPDNNFYVQPDGDVAVTFTEVSQAASDEISMEVYHVNDAVTTAESVSDVVEEGTEISFDAEHFSIYTIVFVKSPTDTDGYTIKINAYDTNGNSIGYDSIPETIEIVTGNTYKINARKSSPAIAGYEFSYAKYNGQEIDWFFINTSNQLMIQTHTSGWNSQTKYHQYDSNEFVNIYYSKDNGTKRGEHIDLRLTGSEMGQLDYAAFYVNGKRRQYDKKSYVMEGASYELRYTGLDVKTSDTIYFEVKFVGDDRVLVTTPSEQKNKEAYERCYRDHSAAYPVGGFDYLLDVDRDFHIDADIVYHSNFANDATKNQKVHYDGQQQSVNQTLKSYAETELAKPTETCTFLGWGLSADATENQKVTSVTVSASQTQPIHVYAIWKKVNIKFVDSENEQTVYDNQSLYQGQKPENVKNPQDKENKTFDGWKIKDNKGKYTGEFSFDNVVSQDITVGALWKLKTTSYKVITKYQKLDGTYSEDSRTVSNVDVGSWVDPVKERPASVDDKYEFDADQSTKGWVQVKESPQTVITIVYKLKSTTYTVQYYYQNANWKYDSAPSLVSLPRSGKVSGTAEVTRADKIPESSKPGYEFDTAANNVLKIDSLNKDATKNILKVYFKHTKYSVTYKYATQKDYTLAKNVIPADEPNHFRGESVEANTKDVPTVEGYTFSGWFVKSGLKPKPTGTVTTFNMQGDNVVLEGYFKANENTPYVVEHYTENLPGSTTAWKREKIDTGMTGTTDAPIVYGRNGHYVETTFEGFTFDSSKTEFYNGTTKIETVADRKILGNGQLVIKLYYTRNKYKVSYEFTDEEAPYGRSDLPVDNTEYYYGQTVQLADDATAPGHTFSGWTPHAINSGLPRPVFVAEEISPAEGGIVSAIRAAFLSVIDLIKGEDGEVAEPKAFEMPASNVLITGSFEKTPYNVVIELKGNAEGGSFDYELPYIADKQTAPVEFELEVYLNGNLISASAATSDNLDVLMASLDNVMSLGALTVYAAEGEEAGDITPEIPTPIAFTKVYNGDAQEVIKTVEKKVTVDGREYTVTVNLAGGYGTDARDYDIYIDSLTFKLGDKDVSDLFTTNMVEKQVVGKLTITPAMITIKADDKSKTEGQADPTFTSKLSGLVGKDAEHQEEVDNFILPQVKYDRESGEAPGRYKITPRAPREDDYEQVIVVHPGDENNLRSLEEASQQLEELSREDAIQAGVEEYLEQGVVKELQDREEYQLPPVIRILRNYDYQFVDGYLTINGRGGDDDDDDDTPDTPTTVDTPVAAAPAPAVLGAQRAPATGEAPAVLGARRAGTSDTSVLGSIITIIVAAAIAFSMVFIKRKKNEEK